MAAEDSSIVTTGLLVGDTLGQLKFLHVPVSLVGGPAAQASIAKKYDSLAFARHAVLWNAAGIEELVLQQALAQRLNAEDVKASKREVASVCMARVEDWSRVPDGEEGEEDIQLVDVATVLWAGGYLQWIRLDTVQVVCSVLLSILPKPPSSEPDHTYAHPQGGVVRTITDVCDGKRITCVACTESGQLHVVRLDLENKQGCKCSIERSFEVRGPVHALAVSNDGVLAIGGKGNELCLWDSRTGQNMFKAKAPKADMLGYVPKPWVTALEFIPGSGGTKVVAATGHAQIRVYDAHLQRKPVLLIKFGEGPVMSIAISPRGDQLFAGSTSGLGLSRAPLAVFAALLRILVYRYVWTGLGDGHSSVAWDLHSLAPVGDSVLWAGSLRSGVPFHDKEAPGQAVPQADADLREYSRRLKGAP
eukprot:scaffold569_cov408-Prasinococcus_capsulatus_cf.AAC.7